MMLFSDSAFMLRLLDIFGHKRNVFVWFLEGIHGA